MFFIGSNQSPAKDCDDNFGPVGEGLGERAHAGIGADTVLDSELSGLNCSVGLFSSLPLRVAGM